MTGKEEKPALKVVAKPIEEFATKMAAIRAGATEDDEKQVAAIVAKAKKAEFTGAAYKITPAMAAILFSEYNPHNRDFSVPTAEEYARCMKDGQWKRNNATIGFYTDGVIEDGQHRLGGTALAGFTLETLVAFGIERDAILTVDGGKKRFAADGLKLDGITDAKRKQMIVKTTAQYFVKTGDRSAALKSETEIANSVKGNNSLLDEAIDIGKSSVQNLVTPVLKQGQAESQAYLMLKAGWPSKIIRERLALFQLGQSREGENDPYFAAAEYITKQRKAKESRERLTTVKEIGVVMFAMLATERGTKAVRAQSLRDAVKGQLPTPYYPAEQTAEAA